MRAARVTRGSGGEVRMGPISLIALVVALCLAVMSVLAVTTARANRALAERQAAFTADDYANEAVAQEFLARVRAAAADGADPATQATELAAACADEDGTTVTATSEDGRVELHVEAQSGRCLDVLLSVGEDGEVGVEAWRATTLWDEDTGDVLWTGQE